MIHTTAVPYGRTGQGRGPWIHSDTALYACMYIVDGYHDPDKSRSYLSEFLTIYMKNSKT